MLTDRMPLAHTPAREGKYRPRTVKMPDEMYARFTDAALSRGQQNISTFVRDCALIGLDYIERDTLIGAHRGTTGMTAGNPGNRPGNTSGMTAGLPRKAVAR